MSKYLSTFKHLIATTLVAQYSGIALLTLLPFMISGIIFDPWNVDVVKDLSLGSPYIYKSIPAGILLMLCIFVMIATKSMQYLMCVFSSGLLLSMSLKHSGISVFDGVEWSVFYILYTFTSILTFFIIAERPTLSTWLFRGTLVILCLDLILSFFASSFLFIAPLFLAYFPSHSSIIICFLVLALFRMSWKFYVENKTTRAQLLSVTQANPKFRKIIRYKTLSLWWPMPFIFLICLFGYQMLQDRYINQPLIAHLNSLGKVQEPLPKTVETASQAAISRLSQAHSKIIKAQIDARINKAKGDKEAIIKGVEDSLPNRFPGTKTKSCDFGDVNCFGANIAKNTINSAYLSAEDAMLADLRLKLNTVQTTGMTRVNDFKRIVDETFATFEKQTNRRIKNTAEGLRYLNIAALIYGFLVLVKSAMIVFARVFYARIATTPAETQTENDQTSNTAKTRTKSKTKCVKHKYTLTRDDGYQRYYINFRSCGNNIVDRRRIPQPFSLMLKRLMAKNYVMCKVDLSADKNVSECDIIVDPPSEIVMWDLTAQDEILIDMKSLIGFSDTCRLGRTISLSLGSLIFGRAIYYSVTGPGLIFVRTASAPIAANDTNANNVMQASSLIAWRRDTTFNVISSLTKSDTFFSGYSIRKAGKAPHCLIYDTSQTRRVSAGQGIFKMIRAFLVPF